MVRKKLIQFSSFLYYGAQHPPIQQDQPAMSVRRVTFSIDYDKESEVRSASPVSSASPASSQVSSSNDSQYLSHQAQQAQVDLKNLCENHTMICEHRLPSEWMFEDFNTLSSGVERVKVHLYFIKEPWFREKYTKLFRDLLQDVRKALGYYAQRKVMEHGTITPNELKFINSVNDRIIKILDRLREFAGVRDYSIPSYRY